MGKQLNLPPALMTQASSLAPLLGRRLYSSVLNSLSELSGREVAFVDNRKDLHPLRGWPSRARCLDAKRFPSSSEPAVVVGLDSSCASIAETDDGAVYASRLACAFSYKGRVMGYVRFGPMIIYVNESNVGALLSSKFASRQLQNLILLDRGMAERLIRIRLEYAAAEELAEALPQSTLALDGSLKPSLFDSDGSSLRGVLQTACRNEVQVVGFTKATRLRPLNRLAGCLYSNATPPVYADVHETASSIVRNLLGRVVLARFTDDGHVFRVDVASDDVPSVLAKIRFNDLFTRGYPETLRLAHHLSVFTSHDKACVKSYLVRSLHVTGLPTEDLRLAILGRICSRLREGADRR